MLGIATLSFSQEIDIAAAYQQIDTAFVHESADELATALKTYRVSKDYYLCEAYALKKTRQYIIQDRLDFARAAALTVIDNNIDNFDAIDLYSYIDKAVLAKESERQAEENRKRLEDERKAAADARTKQRIENGSTYQAVNTSSGKTVFINEKQATYSPLKWMFRLGLADVMFQKITEPDYSSVKYGLAIGGDIYYTADAFVLGAELLADFHMLSVTGEDEVMSGVRFVPQLAFSPLSRYVFLRVGIATYGMTSEDKDKSNSVDSFTSPLIGLGIADLTIKGVSLSAHYDYCLGSFAYEDISNAMETGLSLMFPLAVNERSKIGLEFGVSDLLFVTEDGMENRAKAMFAIGVGNVNK